MGYKQFCPISKAMDLLGEKWTLLIIRELLLGSSRFGELQQGLSQISPSLLSKRLTLLEREGLIYRKRILGQRGYEYFPSESCKELFPIMEHLGVWGMRWARHQMEEDDFDLNLLMLHLERSIQADKLPGKQTVIRFNFDDVSEYSTWWVVVCDDDIDVCIHDPGKEVDIYFNTSVKVMCQLWMEEISYKKAIIDKKLELLGPKALTNDVASWLKPNLFAGIPSARQILEVL
ncbi:MAG: helix-turn-helix domain-containing protein [Pseudomonadales bacterium]